MRVPLAWLKEFATVPELSLLAERLTLGGLELEAVEQVGPDVSGIRVGHVLECGRHSNADRLSVCRVDAGEGDPVEIVCGAPNVAAGQKVAVATPGQRLPDGTKLKRTKIRGVVSQGMICSERELGLGEASEGILVLPEDAPVGRPLAEALEIDGTVLEIALTPNRGDCASILGVAREVRAHFGGELRLPPCEPPEQGEATDEAVQVVIDDPEGCAQYVARVVRQVRVGPSPDWVVRRLEVAGVRPINTVVDITNLVMLELGQPLHAFDLGKLRGDVIRVRAAAAGEKLVTLDGQTRELTPEDLVIADAERPIAIAGVMGGAESEVDPETRDILIESAQFHATRVRRSARRLGLHTEASYRFERGVDREGVRRAADRAARLLAEVAGGEVAPGALHVQGRLPPATEEILLDPNRVNRLLGTGLARSQIVELLDRVGVAAGEAKDGRLRCGIPSYRNDLERAEDLIEEVARIHGYERIPTTMPEGRLESPRAAPVRRLVESARDALAALGFVESMSFPFASPGDADRLGLAPDDPRRAAVRLQNPIAAEEAELRTTLGPSLLRLVRHNRARQAERVRLFEVARVFRARVGEELPEERLHVAAVLTPESEAHLWEPAPGVPLFFQAKGVAEALLRALGFPVGWTISPGEPYLHPQEALGIEVGGQPVGVMGEVHPNTAAAFEIDEPCALLVVDLDRLVGCAARERRYQEISRHPRMRRDLAVLLPTEAPAGEVLEAILGEGGALLTSAEIFDRYEGKGVPAGRVSVAFRLVFQRLDRALQDREVAAAIERIVAMLSGRFQGELR